MMKLAWFLLFMPSLCFAAPTEVIYFGGYGSSASQMRCWESGARSSGYALDYNFRGIEYPAGAGADQASAVAKGQDTIRKIVSEIANHPSRHYIIVGHSSGAAISNRVAELVKNPTQIEMVNLDGFRPSAELQKRVKGTCWYAMNSKTGLMSRNAASMKSCLHSKAFQANQCKSAWCLHFSLVNTEAPGDLQADNFKSMGYKGCQTNLSFLGSSSATPSRASTPAEGAR